MNTAINVIMQTRSILRDESEECVFSDVELLESLERAQNMFISEFRENILRCVVPAAEFVELEAQIAHIFEIKLAQKDAPKKQGRDIPYALPTSAFSKNEPVFYHLSGRMYGLRNVNEALLDECELRIIASFFSVCDSLESPLVFDSMFNFGLSLHIVCEKLLSEKSSNALQKLGIFQAELEKQKANLRAINNIAMTKTIKTSTMQL